MNPKCDNNWYKFDDEVVSKCSKFEAINKNFGNQGESNAYMLAFVKDTAKSDVLAPIKQLTTQTINMIEGELEKERQQQILMENQIEFILFTTESLSNVIYKRGANMFDTKHKNNFIKIYIERSKSIKDLQEYLHHEVFRTNPERIKYRLWKLTSKGELIDWPLDADQHTIVDKDETPLTEIFDVSNKNYCFVMNAPITWKPLDQHNHGLLFLKQYDSITDTLTFFNIFWIKMSNHMSSVLDFIRSEFHINRDVPLDIFPEKTGASTAVQSVSDVLSIFELADKHLRGGFFAKFVFEFYNETDKPRYGTKRGKPISTTDDANEKLSSIKSEFLSIYRSRFESRHLNTILVQLKMKMADRDLEMNTRFDKDAPLLDIVNRLSFYAPSTEKPVRLFNVNQQLIDEDFYSTTIEDYINANIQSHRMTRSKATTVTFYYDFDW